MAGSLVLPRVLLRIRLGPILLSLLLPLAIITGLLFMHVLTTTPVQEPAHETTHVMEADTGTTLAVVGGSEHGAHAGGECLSSATKLVGISPAITSLVRAAPLPGPMGNDLPEARGAKADVFSLCVLRH